MAKYLAGQGGSGEQNLLDLNNQRHFHAVMEKVLL